MLMKACWTGRTSYRTGKWRHFHWKILGTILGYPVLFYTSMQKNKQTHQYKIQQFNSLLNLTCGVAASIVLKASVSRRGNLFGVAEAVGKRKCCVIEDDCLLQKRIFFSEKKRHPHIFLLPEALILFWSLQHRLFLKTMNCAASNSHVFLGQVHQCLISQVTRLCICVIIRFSVYFFFIYSYIIQCLDS